MFLLQYDGICWYLYCDDDSDEIDETPGNVFNNGVVLTVVNTYPNGTTNATANGTPSSTPSSQNGGTMSTMSSTTESMQNAGTMPTMNEMTGTTMAAMSGMARSSPVLGTNILVAASSSAKAGGNTKPSTNVVIG